MWTQTHTYSIFSQDSLDSKPIRAQTSPTPMHRWIIWRHIKCCSQPSKYLELSYSVTRSRIYNDSYNYSKFCFKKKVVWRQKNVTWCLWNSGIRKRILINGTGKTIWKSANTKGIFYFPFEVKKCHISSAKRPRNNEIKKHIMCEYLRNSEIIYVKINNVFSFEAIMPTIFQIRILYTVNLAIF